MINNNRLLIRLKNQEEDALYECITKYKPYVAYIVGNIIGAALAYQDKEEVIADVFINLWKNIDKIDLEKADSLKSYIGAIARNLSKNKLRDHEPLQNEKEIDDNLSLKINIEDEYILKEDAVRLIDCIKSLNEVDRQIFIKYHYYHKRIKVISKETGLSESAIKSRLSRARMRIKNLMDKEI